jgi:SAM-dependent methyltransferase
MEPRHAFEDWLRVQRTLATLTPGMKSLLDVGCGSGRMWELCPTWIKPRRVYGIEPDETLAWKASHRLHLVRSHKGGQDESQFDAVSFYGVLEHVDDPAALIHEYSDAKKMIFTVPNANSFHRELGVELGMIALSTSLDTQDIAVGHKRVYTLDTFLEVVYNVCAEELGMKLIDSGSIGFKFTSNSEMMMFQDRWDAIYSTAIRRGLCGPGKYQGADLYMVVSR